MQKNDRGSIASMKARAAGGIEVVPRLLSQSVSTRFLALVTSNQRSSELRRGAKNSRDQSLTSFNTRYRQKEVSQIAHAARGGRKQSFRARASLFRDMAGSGSLHLSQLTPHNRSLTLLEFPQIASQNAFAAPTFTEFRNLRGASGHSGYQLRSGESADLMLPTPSVFVTRHSRVNSFLVQTDLAAAQLRNFCDRPNKRGELLIPHELVEPETPEPETPPVRRSNKFREIVAVPPNESPQRLESSVLDSLDAAKTKSNFVWNVHRRSYNRKSSVIGNQLSAKLKDAKLTKYKNLAGQSKTHSKWIALIDRLNASDLNVISFDYLYYWTNDIKIENAYDLSPIELLIKKVQADLKTHNDQDARIEADMFFV